MCEREGGKKSSFSLFPFYSQLLSNYKQRLLPSHTLVIPHSIPLFPSPFFFLLSSFSCFAPFHICEISFALNVYTQGRVRTKAVKRAAKLIVEKYYPRLTQDFAGMCVDVENTTTTTYRNDWLVSSHTRICRFFCASFFFSFFFSHGLFSEQEDL